MEDLEFLKREITSGMTLSDIIDVFERMCQIPIENDMVLFETGTFSFTGEPLFYFSIVRQFPNDEEEFYQIHIDVLYKPNDENKMFADSVWNDEINDSIFDYIRNSKAFHYAENDEYIKVDIYMDET